ncbi:MAG: methyltransferase domain-containing protein [Actinomycetota bacterium]|nr:methyltransferase domain-containing protein [Actinomycetota bacterium]
MATAAPRPAGIERALALLADPADATADVQAGYLDLLGPGGDSAPECTGLTQSLMLTRAVPFVYERWWRPALGRAAKGVLGPRMADEHRIARLLLGLRPGDGVLDVACGPGNFTRDFAGVAGPAGLVVGIDASETMLARAVRDTPPEQGERTAYVRGDAVRLPFRDASFDGVCCFAALHLFDDPMTALDHMTRVLTPGGRLAIFTSCRAVGGPLRGLDTLAGAGSGMHVFEADDITGALTDRGLVDVHQRVAGFTQFVGGRLPRV